MSTVSRGDAENTRSPQKLSPADLTSTRGILQILWRRQLIIYLSVIVCLVTAIIYISQATPVYASHSRIYIDNSIPRPLSEILTTGSVSGNYLFTQCDVITSSPVIKDALNARDGALRRLPSLVNKDNQESTIRSNLTANVGQKTDIITVSFESPYPDDCAAVVNEVVRAYIAGQDAKRRTTTTGLLGILSESIAQERDNANRIQNKIKDYIAAHSEISLVDARGSVVIQKLNMLTETYLKENAALVDAKTQHEAAKALMNDPDKIEQLIMMNDVMGRNRWNDEMETLTLRRDVLRAQLGEKSPNYLQIQTQIDAIGDRIKASRDTFVKSWVAAREQQYLASQRKVEELQKQMEQARGEATKVQTASAELDGLRQELNRSLDILNNWNTKFKEIKVNQQDTATVTVQILETAQPYNVAIKPKKMNIILMSVVLGLMMGFGAALLQDWMDQRMRSVDEIAAALQLPILGVVPHIAGSKTAMARGMEVHVEPMSEVSEAYRTIRTAVYFGIPEGQDKTILVTSPAPGDGKTTMASNLAIAMAQAGHTVLLVDCDFRRPRQHRIFGLKDDLGLSSVLAGQHELDSAIQGTAVPNLSLLPCGPIPNNPSEILNSQVFADTIDELKGKFDHVVIDSPPVNPVTDARILAASSDVTIIVVRADKSTRKLSENAKQSLLGVGAKILGVVVNDAPRSGRGYGGYGYGYYSDRLYRDRTSRARGNASNGATAAAGEKKSATRV